MKPATNTVHPDKNSINAAMRARVLFKHDVGDLDLELRGPDGELLSWAQTVTDNEEIYYTWTGAATTGYVKVIHHSGGPVNYHLRISNPAAAPQDLTATKGDPTDKILVTWLPGTQGANPQGYRVYAAPSEQGPYDQVASKACHEYGYDSPTGRYVFEFEPEDDDHPCWFKAVAYFEGRSDSDYSNVDYGYSLKLARPRNAHAT